METILLILHVLFAAAIVGLVLLQKSEGGGLGIGGGGGGGGGGAGSMQGLMSSRGAANFLTRATAVVAALFFASSMALSFIVANPQDGPSLLRDIQQQEPSAASEPPAADQMPSVPTDE